MGIVDDSRMSPPIFHCQTDEFACRNSPKHSTSSNGRKLDRSFNSHLQLHPELVPSTSGTLASSHRTAGGRGWSSVWNGRSQEYLLNFGCEEKPFISVLGNPNFRKSYSTGIWQLSADTAGSRPSFKRQQKWSTCDLACKEDTMLSKHMNLSSATQPLGFQKSSLEKITGEAKQLKRLKRLLIVRSSMWTEALRVRLKERQERPSAHQVARRWLLLGYKLKG